MSSARFVRLMQDAYTNDDIHAARDVVDEYYKSHCLHPVQLEVVDSHTGTKRTILQNCGKCYHCMESKINEWCTRMYAHAEDFKNVYFVTLTYRSITNLDYQVNHLLLEKLKDAVWHFDSFNTYHHSSYSPCLLVKSHYQNFLKRLRRNTGLKDITYVLSGEYGEKLGRPHFHLILFTNGTLTKRDIVRAWSLCLWQSDAGDWSYRTNQRYGGTAYDFPIGRVDFHDLVRNGTFNTTAKVKIDGTYMNASNCFSYVAKYVVKRDTPNLKRVGLAYNSLFQKKEYCKLFNDEVPYSLIKDYMVLAGFSFKESIDYINKRKELKYEKIIFEPLESVYKYGLCPQRSVKVQSYCVSDVVYPENLYEFRDKYRPFCEFSRGTPIGSVYATRNIQEFTQGVFTKPLLQTSGYVVPNYFRVKASDYLYGFREVRKTFSGRSFALGNLPNLLGFFQESERTGVLQFPHSRIDSPLPYYFKDLFIQPSLYADKFSGERIVFNNGYARHYRYSRSARAYVLTRDIPISDFIRYWTTKLVDEFSRHEVELSRSKSNMRDRDTMLLMLTDMGDDESLVTNRFYNKQRDWLKQQNEIYKSLHNSAE